MPAGGALAGVGPVVIAENDGLEDDDGLAAPAGNKPVASGLAVAAPEGFRGTPLELTEGEQQWVAPSVTAAGEQIHVLGLALTPGASPGGRALLKEGDQVGDQRLGG